jgi:hypothetical protein
MRLLQLTPDDFGRYRDIYMEDGFIVVHTRNGGCHRDDYDYVFHAAESHPWYSHNKDCDFDYTYADIYFRIPEGEAQSIAALVNEYETPQERWDKIFKALTK